MENNDGSRKTGRPKFITENSGTASSSTSHRRKTELNKDDLRKLRDARKKWKSLREKDGYFVFFLGKSGSSKSTILATICLYLQNNYQVLQSTDSKVGILYIDKLIRTIGRGEFPELTDYHTIIDYDLKISMDHPQIDDLNITFIELAGEDIEKFAMQSDNKFQGDMESFIEEKNDKIIFLLVLPNNEKKSEELASEFDSTYVQFLSRIKGKCKNIGIIASKWDLNTKRRKHPYVDPVSFIRDKYKSVVSWTENHDNCFVTAFTVGEVIISRKDKKPRIKKLTVDYCINLVNWILTTTVLSELSKEIEEDVLKLGIEMDSVKNDYADIDKRITLFDTSQLEYRLNKLGLRGEELISQIKLLRKVKK